jgi:Ca-activated chloride channel homolog
MTEMNDDDLKGLNQLKVPLPTPEARRRAVGASLMAFDRQQAGEKESPAATQGTGFLDRLKSIAPRLKGNWIMDTRRLVPAGTAVLALLILVPLGYQLYSTTALTPPRPTVTGVPPVDHPAAPESKPVANATPPVATTAATQPLASADAGTAANAVAGSAGAPKDKAAAGGPTAPAALPGPVLEKPSPPVGGLARDQLTPAQPLPDADARAAASISANAPVPAAPAAAPGAVATESTVAPKMTAGAIGARAATQLSGDKFQNFAESQQKAVATDPVSTFSIDVDTASYAYVRRALNEGRIPEPDAVRLEEMINYFPYDYPAPTSASEPFKPTIAVFPTPWNSHTELMEIGIKGYVPPPSARKPSHLVFLIDTSGSMDEPDKLPLLKRALGLLVSTLTARDTVSIVAYAGSAGIVLEPTPASDRAKIMSALDHLSAGGSTAGAEGIELAYQLAEQHKIDGNNRVILATDGDFNVGISDPEQLKRFIRQKRSLGIGLSVLGFGEGNLDDATMQALAQNGDGNASYIDTLSEAQKVLVKEAGSTLDTIARDVKIQVEFNPATVSSYRLIGYETRALNREDFNNDKVDAGDVGAGHTVTALYEITPVGADAAPAVDPLRYGTPSPDAVATTAAPAAGRSAELADVKLRYKLPGSDTSKLIEEPVTPAMVVTDIARASDDARWAAAVAAFGQKLKGSDYAGNMSYGDIKALAAGARGADPDGYRSEFLNLVSLAGTLTGADAPPQPADATAAPAAN